jgi:hypothetical protein
MKTNKMIEENDARTVNSKSEYYQLYERGFFGNKPLTWNSIEEIVKSGWNGKICIRGKKGIARSKARFNLTLEETEKYLLELEKEGIPRINLTFNQSLPDEDLLIQGEVMRSTRSYSLTYTTIKEPMNYALAKETLCAEGLTALNLIKSNLFPSSYEDLQTLFSIFPDSVIEFSSYRFPLGSLPNRNTLIWEVRNY